MRSGRKDSVTAMAPVTFVAKARAAFLDALGVLGERPALLMRTSRRPWILCS